jgi:hypothetical protein
MASVAEDARAPLADEEDESRPRHDDDDPDADHETEPDGADGTRRRKKRRIIQNSDRKYCCSEENCGKKYSRAEHLYRHQLNRMSINFHDSRYFICQPPACSSIILAEIHAAAFD